VCGLHSTKAQNTTTQKNSSYIHSTKPSSTENFPAKMFPEHGTNFPHIYRIPSCMKIKETLSLELTG